MVIRIRINSEKGHSKAIKVAASITGVESVTIGGEEKNLLLVIGVGIDSNQITEKLRRKVGHAEVVELRTVDGGDIHDVDHYGAAGQNNPYRYHPSPYNKQRGAGGGDMLYYAAAAGGGGMYQPQGGGYYGSTPGRYGARDHYQYNGGYPAQQYGQQQDYYSYPAAAAGNNMHTVVHHQYGDDPNSCSVM